MNRLKADCIGDYTWIAGTRNNPGYCSSDPAQSHERPLRREECEDANRVWKARTVGKTKGYCMQQQLNTKLSILGVPEDRYNMNIIKRLASCLSVPITDFNGKSKNSGSNSDVYQFGVPIRLKKSQMGVLPVHMKVFVMEDDSTLVYEAVAYKHLFELYEKGYTRNVPVWLASSFNCTGEDLLQFVKIPDAKRRFWLSLHSLLLRETDRPAIDAPQPDEEMDRLIGEFTKMMLHARKTAERYGDDMFYFSPDKLEDMSFEGYRLGYTVSVAMKGVLLDDYIQNYRSNKNHEEELTKIIFQVLYTVIVMNFNGIYSCDLSFYNVMIDRRLPGESKECIYILGDNAYLIVSDLIPRIFDLDMGYIRQLGENPLNSNQTFETALRSVRDDFSFFLSSLLGEFTDELDIPDSIPADFLEEAVGYITHDIHYEDKPEEVRKRLNVIERVGSAFRVPMSEIHNYRGAQLCAFDIEAFMMKQQESPSSVADQTHTHRRNSRSRSRSRS